MAEIKDSGNRRELWKSVKGYEGLYEVSNLGRVRSKRVNTRITDKTDRVMKQKVDNHGYYRVNLHKNGKMKAYLVSRMVAEAFIFNPGNLPQVGHANDDKTDNTIDNLYWTDSKENNNHNGKMEKFQKAHNDKIMLIAEKLSIKVVGTNINTGKKLFFNSMQETKNYGFDPAKVSMCVNGKRMSHGGYKWERMMENGD
jgi:hypothetical protein